LMIIWIWREKEKILRSQIKTETTKRNTIETLVILNLEREGEIPRSQIDGNSEFREGENPDILN
jgi:hypothetical protein